jgi:hypothetical protein
MATSESATIRGDPSAGCAKGTRRGAENFVDAEQLQTKTPSGTGSGQSHFGIDEFEIM